jgi:glycine dehydrogenase subunit 1
VADFVPHTDADIAAMLGALGLSSTEELFAAVPAAIRLAGGLDLPAGLGEFDVAARLDELGAKNASVRGELTCFAGGGSYDHEVPAVTRALASRPEFVTSYTPYQPEVAQGVLQALFEYQTMVSRLSGLPIANASLYDGAAALVEAVNLAVASTGNQRVLVSSAVHPNFRQVLATFARGTGHEIVELPLRSGKSDWQGATGPAGAVVVGYPNYLGVIEEVAEARAVADATGALLVVVQDPVAAGLLISPGDCGADVVVSEGQVFGTPLGFGGPYLGLFSCREDLVRRLPGRLVGESVDLDERLGYVTTLRAREQDIRREKASSNVCTTQTLMAVTAAIQLAWLGPVGLRKVALGCARGTRYLLDNLAGAVHPLYDTAVLREVVLRCEAGATVVVDRMLEEGFLAGIALREGFEGTELEDTLLVAVTERRTREEIDAFVNALGKAAR